MLRKLHGLPGLFAALLLLVLAISGAVLSIVPALERSAATVPAAGDLSVAALAERIVANYPSTEQITRSPPGKSSSITTLMVSLLAIWSTLSAVQALRPTSLQLGCAG